MIDLQDSYRKQIIEAVNRHLSEAEVLIYGSRVKGTAKPYSDVDIIIKSNRRINESVLADIRDELSDSDIPYIIDLSDWHSLSDAFKSVISDSCKLL